MNENVPVLVGVPESLPVDLLSLSPVGRVPEDFDHVNGAVPFALRVTLYFLPFVPAVRVAPVVIEGFVPTNIVNSLSA